MYLVFRKDQKSFFYKSLLYKGIQTQISQIHRQFKQTSYWYTCKGGYHFQNSSERISIT